MIPSHSELRWYLIHCKPRQDERALKNLRQQGFSCFRPARTVERWRRGRANTRLEPLFPNYLFIQLNQLNDNWYPIRSTRGVNRIVGFNGPPLPIRDTIVEEIHARLGSSITAEHYLKPGEHVRIAEGAFSQVDAILVARDGDERVVLLLNILQQDQRLSFALKSVRKVG
jgi:transcriptional antiterminator RfaH